MERKFPDLRDYLALYSDGDIPMILRNTRERFLMSVKPNSKAASDTLLPSERRFSDLFHPDFQHIVVYGGPHHLPEAFFQKAT